MSEVNPKVVFWVDVLTKLVGPALLLLVCLAMLINNNIVRAEPSQETNLAAGAIAVLALGRGFDKFDKLRGRD